MGANIERIKSRRGRCVHGINVGKFYHNRLIAQVLERHKAKVKMDIFYQKICRKHYLLIFRIENSGIISNTS
jgi:hypothetical protein